MSNQKEEIERENEEFDRDGFIDEIEMAIDYGFEISQEDYDLYQQCINERTAEEIAVVEDFDMDM